MDPLKDRLINVDALGASGPGTKPTEEIKAEVVSVDGKPRYHLETRSPEAVVVHCGDPRFQRAFRRFIKEELGIASYAPIVIGGGVHAFGMQTFLPKNFKILWEQIKFFVREGNLKQVIVINHEDCKWYNKMRGYHPRIDALTKGKFDLMKAASRIVSDFSGVSVRSYWAAIEGDKVVFSEVVPE